MYIIIIIICRQVQSEWNSLQTLLYYTPYRFVHNLYRVVHLITLSRSTYLRPRLEHIYYILYRVKPVHRFVFKNIIIFQSAILNIITYTIHQQTRINDDRNHSTTNSNTFHPLLVVPGIKWRTKHTTTVDQNNWGFNTTTWTIDCKGTLRGAALKVGFHYKNTLTCTYIIIYLFDD